MFVNCGELATSLWNLYCVIPFHVYAEVDHRATRKVAKAAFNQLRAARPCSQIL